jgi:hypothetical protein
MPDALKIFITSLIAGLAGASAALRLGTWIVQRFFPHEPMAMYVVLLMTPAVGMATAVTTGVLVGRARR